MRFLDIKARQEYFYITQEMFRRSDRMDTNKAGARALLKMIRITGYFYAYFHELPNCGGYLSTTDVDTYFKIKKEHGYNY